MYIIDAFIGNFDRHGANWGFIKKNNSYRLAPIFDNGSFLFPRRNTDTLMIEAMTNPEVIAKMTFEYPTSQIRLNKKKSSYFDVIHCLQFPSCNDALVRIFHRIDMNKIKKLIDSQQMLTNIQKEFYYFVLQYRYESIIKASYEKWKEEYYE